MNRKLGAALVIAAVAALAAWALSTRPGARGLTSQEIAARIAEVKSARKAEMAAEGRPYEPGAFPNDWEFVQRAYPYGRLNYEQAKESIEDAAAFRIAARRSRSGTWVERGPSNIGARVTDLVVHPTDPDIVYAAIASGGVFRSDDGGSTWYPIFDEEPVLTIGDIALDPSDPDVIYVGTGEANAASHSWFGLGVFKSTDGGATWSYSGLEETRFIGRIVVDPHNPDRVWVAATGTLFGKNPERGIYRSLDAGDTWDLVLSISDSTAGIDVAIDPTRPDTVYAAMWERVRGLTYRKSGGETSGIYRSHDGGDSWVELTNGLHTGANVGRIGLSVAASSPNIVYAIYADDPGYFYGVYKSINGGDSWTRTNDGALLDLYSTFGWYFGQIAVDPVNPDRVFALGVPLYRTQNGGATWQEKGQSNHVDHHALAFDPSNPSRIFEGNDGGIYVSNDSGSNWTKLYDQPTNQFYEIEIDYQHPDRLYGGTQDNGTLRSLSENPDTWEQILGGDGFYCIVDPTDSYTIFAEYQYGYLYKSTTNASTWEWALDGVNDNDRRNWSTPVVLDPSDPQTMYYGTYRVYRSTNGSDSWSAISPDLTNGDQGSGFGTVTTIAVAPSNPSVVYVGTDDSNVWVTLNGGLGWTNVSASLPNRWVTRVAVDPTDHEIAYATFSGRRWDEQIGHVYRTADAGASWTDITGDLPDAPINAIAIDPDLPSVIYIGSDVGCFFTKDQGASWAMLGDNLPSVPVYDLKIHQPTRTLVAGTHGRSMHSIDLDTVTGIESPPVEGGRLVLELRNYPNPFPPSTPTTIAYRLSRPSDVTLSIYDVAGRLVRTLEGGSRGAGLHEVRWDGRNEDARIVAAGTYFAALEAGGEIVTAKLNVLK
jgi:photosystem II stability/assembly factor-like uncharacterized protein